MSNAPRANDGAFDFQRAKSESRGEPFPIRFGVDDVVMIPRPTGGVLFDVEQATSSKQVIRLLCGEHADTVLDALSDADFEVANELAEKMQKHFGMGEYRASRG